ncbi:MAG: YcgN family cysteine cluster protein [Pseudomonadota bacterium]
MEPRYWEKKSLLEMSTEEWEALCDGCGRCCLNKLEDWDTGEIYFTNVACTLFDGETCRCGDYENRFETVPDCVKLKPQDMDAYPWLPPSCAYRRIHEGKALLPWHPLLSESTDTVHAAGASVRGRILSEDGIAAEDFELHLVDWVNAMPR